MGGSWYITPIIYYLLWNIIPGYTTQNITFHNTKSDVRNLVLYDIDCTISFDDDVSWVSYHIDTCPIVLLIYWCDIVFWQPVLQCVFKDNDFCWLLISCPILEIQHMSIIASSVKLLSDNLTGHLRFRDYIWHFIITFRIRIIKLQILTTWKLIYAIYISLKSKII